MKRLLLALICLIIATAAQAQNVGFTGGYTSCPNLSLPRDANGWSLFTTPTTGTIYYISTNDGLDTNNGTTVNTPWQHISKAVTQAATDTGRDSWFLLKKGDVFKDQAIGFVNANGKDCAHPMVWGSYDPSQPGVVDPAIKFSISSITCTAGTATGTTTTAHGWTNGKPYQLVLTQELPAGFNGEFAATITGATTFTFSVSSCPAASDTLHGIVTTGRPLIEPSASGQCLFNDGGGSTGDYFAAVGLHCYAYTLDPYNPSFSKSAFQSAMAGSLIGASQSLSSHIWRLYEDNQFTALTAGIVEQATLPTPPDYYLEFSRNVFYHSPGNYVQTTAHLLLRENVSLVQDWDPVFSAGQSVTITTGTPGIITQAANNFYISGTVCSQIQFTATSLPTGLSAGTTYFVTNVSGNNFNVDTTDCTGAHQVAISTTGTSVVAYWLGSSGSGCGFICAYPQVSVFEHGWYLQNQQFGGGVWNVQAYGNIIGLISGTACECGNNGIFFNNLFFQNPSSLIQGKGSPPGWVTSLHWDVTYNGFFELSPQYLTPSTRVAADGLGDIPSSQTGTVNFSNNLLAYEPPLGGTGTGYGSSGGGITGLTATNNVACGIATPIRNVDGAIITVSVTTPGTGLTATTASSTYSNGAAAFTKIPFTGGSGIGASGTITIAGGVVTAADVVSGGTGPGFKVGDVLSFDPKYAGGTGSGAVITVNAVDSAGHINPGGLTVTSGGTSYTSAYQNVSISSTSGTGSGDLYQVAVAANGTVTGIYPEFGNSHNFAVNDTITFLAASIGGTGTNPVATVTSVTSNPTTNNTYQAANCNNLQSATGSLNGLPNSVPPPKTPSATPPTDVVGSYFATLPYGFTASVPGILSGQASASEMGFVQAAALQQKGNWDTNLMAQTILNWARPQFGMANP